MSQQDARLKEAYKLGFKTAFIPQSAKPLSMPEMHLIPLAHLSELADYLDVKPKRRQVYGA